MIFDDRELRIKLSALFGADTYRFDKLMAVAGLDPSKHLVGADLRDAVFDGSIMDGWNLTDCDLTGASFTGARIRNLITDNAIGLDLTGAELIDKATEPESDSLPDELDWLIAQTQQATKAKRRWPFLERILKEHGENERAWGFLFKHVERERVAKHVHKIIEVWEQTQGSRQKGEELRLRLIRGASPYITVRAALFRNMASRVGPRDDIFEIAEKMIEQEGFFSSGIAAMSVLASTFSDDDRAFALLKNVVSRQSWHGSRHHAVSALLGGFDGLETREFIEKSIREPSVNVYDRIQMLQSFAHTLNTDPAVSDLALRLFDKEVGPEVRAAALDVRATYGDLSQPEEIGKIRAIILGDDCGEVRESAIMALGRRGAAEIGLLLDRATKDRDAKVRASAVAALAAAGYNEEEFYFDILVDDPDNRVRADALLFMSQMHNFNDEDRYYDVLLNEMRRGDPDYAAGMAARQFIRRWPEDPALPTLIAGLLSRLPKNVGGWRHFLFSELKRRDPAHPALTSTAD